MGEVKVMAAMVDPDVIAVTETWTNETIDNAYLKLDGYEIVIREDRSDTEKGRGGGILMYAKNRLRAWR